MELTLVLTHACNMGCAYCYAGKKDSRSMPVETGRAAIDWAIDRCDGDLLLGWFGGEPLLRWDLLTALHVYAHERAASHGIRLAGTVTTNATMLTPERMSWLADHGITVGISIDGDRATHDRLRPLAGGGSSFDAVRAGLCTALARVPMTQTISVVHPGNVADLDRTVAFLLEEGVRVISLSLDPSADWDLGGLDEYRRQLALIGERWLAEFRAGRDLWIEPIDGRIVAQVKGGMQACDRCSAGVDELALAPSGTWYPCERMVGADGAHERRWSLGGDARSGPDPLRVRTMAATHGAEPEECRACPLRDRCQHTCACSNVMASGLLATPGGAQCAAEQAAIAVADQVATALWNEGNALFLRRRYALAGGVGA